MSKVKPTQSRKSKSNLTEQKKPKIKYYKLNYALNENDDVHYSVAPRTGGSVYQYAGPNETYKRGFKSFIEWAEYIPVDGEWGILQYENIPQQIQKSVNDFITLSPK